MMMMESEPRPGPCARFVQATSSGSNASGAHRSGSWRSKGQGLKKDDRIPESQEALRLLEAEALVNEQGEDLIRHNVRGVGRVTRVYR